LRPRGLQASGFEASGFRASRAWFWSLRGFEPSSLGEPCRLAQGSQGCGSLNRQAPKGNPQPSSAGLPFFQHKVIISSLSGSLKGFKRIASRPPAPSFGRFEKAVRFEKKFKKSYSIVISFSIEADFENLQENQMHIMILSGNPSEFPSQLDFQFFSALGRKIISRFLNT
jgi:hypothetical protein